PSELPALPVALGGEPSSERDERNLLVLGASCHGVPVAQPLNAKRQVAPRRRRRIDELPVAVAQEEIGHVSSASSSARNGIASEHASCEATIAPATDPRRAASSSDRPVCRLCPKAAMNASPAPRPLTTSTGWGGTSTCAPSWNKTTPCSPRLSTSVEAPRPRSV